MLHSKLWECNDRSLCVNAKDVGVLLSFCPFRHLVAVCVCLFFCFSSCFISFSPFFFEGVGGVC